MLQEKKGKKQENNFIKSVFWMLVIILIFVYIEYRKDRAEYQKWLNLQKRTEVIQEEKKYEYRPTQQTNPTKPIQSIQHSQTPVYPSFEGEGDDDLDVKEYSNTADFYEDHADWFEDEEEAEDYYYDNGGE